LAITKDGIDVRRCSECGHLFVSPRLPEAAVSELYGNAYWDTYTQAIGSPALRDRVRFDYENGFGKLNRDVLPYRQSGRLLDVGASNGGLVRAARERGFTAEGLEPSADICALAAELQGIELYCGDIRDGHYPSGSFEIVTMHDVLEHVFEPLEILEACREVLVPGGILITETPTTEALDGRLDLAQWECMSPLEHVHLFSEANLARLYARAGFEIIDLYCPHENNVIVIGEVA
jgi:2-polyprenyl-3-methyl-5-hydroxy-6-metoxy-1,4-benzoquinol methylase